MKKSYIKPDICIENFLLSYNIALGCDGGGQSFTDECAQNYELSAVIDALTQLGFAGGESTINWGDKIIKVCYHTSTGLSVFTS